MRKGKLAAQVAHASMAVLLDQGDWVDHDCYEMGNIPVPMCEWLRGSFAKIVVGCKDEVELLKLYSEAKMKGIPCSLIKDEGRTEFKEPTHTCIAIGPDDPIKVDSVTSELKLL